MATARTTPLDHDTADDPAGVRATSPEPAGVSVSPADALERVLESAAEAMGYEIVTIELVGRGRGRIVRVYLDTLDPEIGVTLDDCTRMGRVLSAALDAVEADTAEESAHARAVLAQPYTLEVSSPGLDRVLRKRRHFERFVGARVVVRTHQPPSDAVDPKARQRTYHGFIEGVVHSPAAPPAPPRSEDQRRGLLRLRELDDGRIIEIPIGAIKRANLVYGEG